MFNEYEKFMAIVKSDKSLHTVDSYYRNLQSFFNTLNIQSIDDIKNLNSDIMRKYMADAKDGGLQVSSVNARMRVIKAFFNWLVENKYMINQPMDSVHMFKEPKKIAVVLTREERDAMILNCGTNIKLKTIIALMLYTGVRREEVTNIKVEDIHDGKILIHGKGKKERLLVLNTYVQDLIEKYLKQRGTDFEYLFCSRKGFKDNSGYWHKLSPESIRCDVKRAARLAGIDPKRIEKISAHCTRRTFACDLARSGASSFQIQKSLGHSNINTTSIYIAPVGAEIANDVMMNQPAPVEVG
jgi:integrase/recombinase XerD